MAKVINIQYDELEEIALSLKYDSQSVESAFKDLSDARQNLCQAKSNYFLNKALPSIDSICEKIEIAISDDLYEFAVSIEKMSKDFEHVDVQISNSFEPPTGSIFN